MDMKTRLVSVQTIGNEHIFDITGCGGGSGQCETCTVTHLKCLGFENG